MGGTGWGRVLVGAGVIATGTWYFAGGATVRVLKIRPVAAGVSPRPGTIPLSNSQCASSTAAANGANSLYETTASTRFIGQHSL
jgi:hypothetical protein